MYQICVFDLDGTLVYTMEDIAASVNVALRNNGFPAHSVREIQALVGYSVGYMCERAVPEGAPADAGKRVLRDYLSHYERHCCDVSRPYEGILRSVQRLKSAGMRLAVVSNKPHRFTVKVVETLFPRDTFSMVLGMMEKYQKKPNAEPLNFVLNEMGVSREMAVYVGDSEVDVRFAENAGIDCVSATWGYRTRAELLAAGAKRLIDDPEELPGALL